MVIRNEVTTRSSLKRSIFKVGANRMLWDGKIESEAKALGNSKDMLTDLRLYGR
jgi:hypothetical protein